MKDTPSFKEDHISQIPAIQLLITLGYQYLTPEEALHLRGDKTGTVILEGVLEQQLRKINQITYKGKTYPFSNSNITEAVNSIKSIPFDGLVKTSEDVYDLLSLGKSFKENIQNNIQSFDLKYIDWRNLENNVFHVTEEFEVDRADGKSTRRPDVVLFINGIPFCVIECKKPDMKEPMVEAISQHIRNQHIDEIPRLFIYSQLLMVLSKNEAKYATVSTSDKFWSFWKEDINEKELEGLVNQPLAGGIKDKLFSARFKYVRKYFDEIEASKRLVTDQDRALYELVRPDRLLELSHKFIVFEAGEKKIARYKQYFAVRKTLERVKEFESSHKRKGGVIWHTQGSGKSLTMVMIAKALAIDPAIQNPRVVIVTDRIDLDDQIWRTFKHCGMEPVQAKTGEHLLEILEDGKASIITTVIKKFEASVNKRRYEIDSQNVFVLVDESHRSQYGSMHAMMKKALQHACYIGFTGTPLMQDEKNTAIKFGGFIDRYTIDEAVEDKAVVPLLYEGRHVVQDVNRKSIDLWFERISETLTPQQQVDLKRKFSRIEKLNSTEQKIYMIAYDISQHYANNWQGTGFKAQLATARKVDALEYKKYFDEIGLVSSEVVISSPDEREGYEDVHDAPVDEVVSFWKKMMDKYGTDRDYNREIISKFKSDDKPEILIVVDKLLTGFDAPRNTILYIAKDMKDHNLLQAIARVNRICEGKDFGFIIDYMGILGELDKALVAYSALEGFDKEDLEGTLANVNEEIKKLPQKHAELWDIFKGIRNKYDEEEYERHLFDKELRDKFYEKLSYYSRTLAIALSSAKFYEDNSDEKIAKYKEDLKFFQKLRISVKKRYAEVVDFKEYEAKVQKLLDTYVTADEIIKITDLVNIFDKDKFQEEVAKVEGLAARADLIAHRTKRTIEAKHDDDPVFYKKFSTLIQNAIDDYRVQRISEVEYFNRVSEYMLAVRDHKDESIPEVLNNRDVAQAFYGVVSESVAKRKNNISKEVLAELAMGIDDIILKNRIVDWQMKSDVQNQMMNQIEDYLLDHLSVKLNFDDVDLIMERVLKIAKRRYE